MEEKYIQELVETQRGFFDSGATLPVPRRLGALRSLASAIRAKEEAIADALYADLGKSRYESYMCETGLTLSEIRYMIKHTPRFAKEHRTPTPLAQYVSRCYQKPSPVGTVLVMSPWNYPLLLSLDPVVDAVAAGNTVILKPSAYAPATSQVVQEIIEMAFPPEYVAVVTGGRAENQALLDQDFDLIFFTGSQEVGKVVLHKSAERLTPAVLELGGKSPVIVDRTAKIPLAARRIVFGKFLNAGQTCVAPDHVYCHEEVLEPFLAAVDTEIRRQFGQDPLANPHYGKIINRRHFDRIRGLIAPEKVVVGGQCNEDTLQIAPTVLSPVTHQDAVMGEEIFGPLLPVLPYRDLDQLIHQQQRRYRPLALYLFAEDKALAQKVTSRLGFGGGCINDTVIHLTTSSMGFGGMRESGMGSYHGKAGFDAFSHTKSIIDKKTWLDLPLRYQPYGDQKDRIVRRFLK